MENQTSKFNKSDDKYGLWRALSARKGQTDLGIGTAEVLTQLFTLNQDSEKARETARLVLSEKIDERGSFTYRAGKTTGYVEERTVTGAQVIAKCKAIVLIGETDVPAVVISEGKQKDGSEKASKSKGDKLAGLRAGMGNPAPAVAPAKK